MKLPNQKEKVSNSKEDSIAQLLISVGPYDGGFVCLKYWFVFGLGSSLALVVTVFWIRT